MSFEYETISKFVKIVLINDNDGDTGQLILNLMVNGMIYNTNTVVIIRINLLPYGTDVEYANI